MFALVNFYLNINKNNCNSYKLIIIIATALKCYICDNFDDANCLKIEKYGSDFLEECQPYRKNTTRCAVLIEKGNLN